MDKTKRAEGVEGNRAPSIMQGTNQVEPPHSGPDAAQARGCDDEVQAGSCDDAARTQALTCDDVLVPDSPVLSMWSPSAVYEARRADDAALVTGPASSPAARPTTEKPAERSISASGDAGVARSGTEVQPRAPSIANSNPTPRQMPVAPSGSMTSMFRRQVPGLSSLTSHPDGQRRRSSSSAIESSSSYSGARSDSLTDPRLHPGHPRPGDARPIKTVARSHGSDDATSRSEASAGAGAGLEVPARRSEREAGEEPPSVVDNGASWRVDYDDEDDGNDARRHSIMPHTSPAVAAIVAARARYTDALADTAVLDTGLIAVIAASSSSDGSAANSDGSSSTASLRSVTDDDDEDDAVTHASSCALRSKTVVTRADEAEYDDDGVPLRVNTLEFVRPLGHGAAGTVYHCIDTATDEERAVKVIPRRNCGRTGSLAKLPEVAAMKDLQHPNIVRLYECIDDVQHGQVLLVMDYVNGGCVATMRDDGTCERLPVDGVALVLRHAASALVHCHSRRVVHGDLKPDNIMMDRRDEARPRALLADFGVATTFYKPVDVGLESVAHDNAAAFLQSVAEGSLSESTSAASGESRHAAQMMRLAAGGPTTTGGTPAFSPPEVLQGGNYTTASDMWALGVTAFCLLFGRLPFDVPAQASLATLKRVICDGEVHYPAEATMDHHLRRWRQVLQRMLAKDPSIRLTALELSRCKLLYPQASLRRSTTGRTTSSDTDEDRNGPLADGESRRVSTSRARGTKALRRFQELADLSAASGEPSPDSMRTGSLFFGASASAPLSEVVSALGRSS